jgi:hypothetical protein
MPGELILAVRRQLRSDVAFVATPKPWRAGMLIPPDGVPVEAAIAGLFTRYGTTVLGPCPDRK